MSEQNMREALEALRRARDKAMFQSVRAPIPLCAEFADIAQDVAFAIVALAEQPAQGEAVELAHLRATEVAYENLKASLIYAPPAPAVPDDTARLNWLESREASLVTHREAIDEGEFAIWWTVAGEVKKVRADSISGHPLGSVRAAIDAAMLAAAPEVPRG